MWDKVQNREGMYFLPSLPLDSFALTDEGEQRNRFFLLQLDDQWKVKKRFFKVEQEILKSRPARSQNIKGGGGSLVYSLRLF